MSQTTAIPFTCGYCGRPVTGHSIWAGGTPYHPECTRGPDYKPETFTPAALDDPEKAEFRRRLELLERRVAALEPNRLGPHPTGLQGP